MGTAENKQALRRLYEEGMNAGDLDVVDDIVDPDFVNHAAPPGTPDGPEGVKATMTMIHRAAPEYHLAIHHVVAEGDLVALHGTGSTGPMEGEFMGADVTGRSTEIPQVHIVRFRDGRAIEHWGVRHDSQALKDLGVLEDARTA